MTDGEYVVVRRILKSDPLFIFETDRGEYDESQIRELANDFGVTDLLEHQHFTPLRSFQLRREALELKELREHHPFKGISGCRVELLEHQLWLALKATESLPVRCLLADEVGLGKTIEAGLIFSKLLAEKKLRKVLVIVPEALKVQWLTELYRRFNIRFRLDHEEMIEEDDYRDFVITSFDRLSQHQSAADLVIVDEAHRILEHEYFEAAKNLLQASPHALLLTATPLVKGSQGLKILIELLRTRECPLPQVFCSKRKDVAVRTWRSVEPVFVSSTPDWILQELKGLVEAKSREKIFLITSTVDQVKKIQQFLIEKIGPKIAAFHEEMDLVERDRQAAYFSDPEGAQFLIASEIGGEGRNFQFASRMILCDLPKDPAVLEQRIGRLDRIGQKKKVIVHCPVQENTDDEFMFELHRDVFETFERPWTGASLRDSSEFQIQFDRAFASRSLPDLGALKQALSATPVDLKQLEGSLSFKLLAHTPELPPLVPAARELDNTEIHGFLEELYDLFGVEVEDFDTQGALKISASSLMFVDYFPGLGSEGEKVLTFDRERALAREDYAYFSVDHPEFLDSLELLLGSDNGRLSLAKPVRPAVRELKLYFVFRDSAGSDFCVFRYLHSAKKMELLKHRKDWMDLEAVDHKRLPPEFLEQLSAEFKKILLEFTNDPQLKGRQLDSLLVTLPL
jgi:ATP-dependent helicase HepA